MTRPTALSERLARRTVRSGECVVWTGAISGKYGRIFVADKRGDYVHRVSYRLAFGVIPDGTQIDHLCRNTLCVNPDHLEAVTQQINLARGNGPWAVNARKMECLRGHPFSESNTYVNRKGERGCRACRRVRRAANRLAA